MTNIAQMTKASFEAATLVAQYLGAPEDNTPLRNPTNQEEQVYEFGFKERIIAKIVSERIPIIFLDVDGVLHDPYSQEAREEGPALNMSVREMLFPDIVHTQRHALAATAATFKKEVIDNLGILQQSFPDIAIVLSSNWRKNYSIATIRSILGFCNHNFFGKNILADFIIDKTVDKISKEEELSLCKDRTPPAIMSEQNKKSFYARSSQIFKWLKDHDLLVSNYIVLDDIYLPGFSQRFIWIGVDEIREPFSQENGLLSEAVLSFDPYCPFPTFHY
jgi:hypothetical protein